MANYFLILLRYLLPMLVAGVSFLLRWIADFTCSSWSQTCRASSEILSHVYMVVFFFLVIVASTKVNVCGSLLLILLFVCLPFHTHVTSLPLDLISSKAKQISDLADRVKTAYRMLTDSKDKHD